jgi:hypothetical protein
VAAVSALTGRVPRLGTAVSAGAALLGPAVAACTGALISDTAVPAWHDGYPEMPFVFVGSAATAAEQNTPARNLGLFGACLELAASYRMTKRIGMVAEPYRTGKGGAYIKAGAVLTVLGAAGSLVSRGPAWIRTAALLLLMGRLGLDGRPAAQAPDHLLLVASAS